MSWYRDRFADDEYARRVAHIRAHGLPVRLRFAEQEQGDFARIYVDPEPQFIALANDRAVMEAQAKGWAYHITVTHFSAMSGADKVLWDGLKRTWNGQTVDLMIQRVTSGATSELAWVGLGADWRLWRLFLKGTSGWKYVEHGHGPHVSM